MTNQPRRWPGPARAGNKVRVGLLCPCLVQGGAEAWMVALSRQCDPGRIAWVGTAVAGTGRADPAMVAALGARMPVARGRGAMRSLAAACDVLVTWAIDGLPALLEGLPRPPKVVAAVHAPPESAWGQTVYARPEGIDRWVAVSELALEAIPPASRLAAPASVIWNAVDLDRLAVRRDRAAMRAAWGVPADAPVALFMQRLSEEKGCASIARLAGSLPAPWHVVVVGDGDERGAVGRDVAGLDRVRLAGADPAAGDVLNAADVFLCLSDYESFGLSLAEAIWSGVPAVTTEVGLARLAPGITLAVPHGADGPTLAAAVMAARDAGPPAQAGAIRPRLDPRGFGGAWSNLIVSLRPPESPPPALSLYALADLCPMGSGPCGCGAAPRLCRHPDRPLEVWRADCLRCVAATPIG